MKRKVKVLGLVGILIVMFFATYELVKFNNYRYTVINNASNKETYIPFAQDLKMMHIYPNIQRVAIGNESLEKIEGLESLTQLKRLMISGSPNITKIEGLDNLRNLEMINLTDNGIEKIEGLSGLNHLGYLQLEGNNISTIENIEEIPLMKNDYCYTVEVTEEERKSQVYVDLHDDSEGNTVAEECFLEEEPEEYVDKYLYNDDFEYGEMVSPLSLDGIQLGDNPIKYITQESYDYIEKYKIPIALSYDDINIDYEELQVI